MIFIVDVDFDYLGSVQSLSGVQLFATPWTATCRAGFPVYHQLSELAQTHVHGVGDAIQPSHPVVPFSSHLQSCLASGLFQRVSSLYQVANVLEFLLQHQSFQ